MTMGSHDQPIRFDQSAEREGDVIAHTSARKRRGRERPRITLNLTAMIDVTFLLLVYFIVATEFKIGEEVFQIDLPPRLQSDRERDPFRLDEHPLRISVQSTPASAGGTGYRLAIEGPFTQPATFEELYVLLRDQQIGPDSMRGLFEVNHPIIIQPGGATRWDHVIGALNAIKRARYTNINFAKPQ